MGSAGKFVSTIDLSASLRKVQAGAGKGLTLATEAVLTEANTIVPHDEGTLERSGQTDVDTAALRGSIYYDTPYAARQHEDMSYRHEGKGQAKWLENTLTGEADTVGAVIAAAIRSELGS